MEKRKIFVSCHLCGNTILEMTDNRIKLTKHGISGIEICETCLTKHCIETPCNVCMYGLRNAMRSVDIMCPMYEKIKSNYTI